MSPVTIPLDVEALPAQLKALRKERAITQRELARRANVSQQTISAIENGKMEPSLKILKSIALVLGVVLVIGAGISMLSDQSVRMSNVK